MAFITWDNTYSVGIKDMDAQHEKMIGIINQLHDAMRIGQGTKELGSIIEEMVAYTQYHFSSEEKILSAQTYPGYLKQKGEHAAFVKKVNEFKTQFDEGKLSLSIEVLNFLKQWWTGHILVEDQKYSAFMNARGIH
ncbi:MAG: hemerythrin family protein [Chloroflexi bacterium]|nr:bacteriohemerythrin [Anaerolineaceae bacterium]NMB89663.1 hemerythrin family protein [Chloroflexota bacterium]